MQTRLKADGDLLWKVMAMLNAQEKLVCLDSKVVTPKWDNNVRYVFMLTPVGPGWLPETAIWSICRVTDYL